MSHKSPARVAQQKHWERMGQIGMLNGLINYILANDKEFIPTEVKNYLESARPLIWLAFKAESKNNEFINLNKKPAWKKGK